jgi:hypothetical protein
MAQRYGVAQDLSGRTRPMYDVGTNAFPECFGWAETPFYRIFRREIVH